MRRSTVLLVVVFILTVGGFVLYTVITLPIKQVNSQIKNCSISSVFSKTQVQCGFMATESGVTVNYYAGVLKSVRKIGNSYYLDLDVGRAYPLSFLVFNSVGVHLKDNKSTQTFEGDISTELESYIGQEVTLLSPNGKNFTNELISLLPKVSQIKSTGVRGMISYLNRCGDTMKKQRSGDMIYSYRFPFNTCYMIVNNIYVN